MENFWKSLHAVTQNTDEMIIKRVSVLKIVFLTPPILNGISADKIIIKRDSILKIVFLTPPILNGISAISLDRKSVV